MKKLIVAAAATSLFALTAYAAGANHSVDRAHSRVGFTAYTKLFNAKGTFKKWNGSAILDVENMANSKVSIDIETKSVDTDSSGRDEHLVKEDFFFSEKYPLATFRSTSFRTKDANNLVVTGDLTIRGVTKKIVVPFKFTEVEQMKKDGSKYVTRRARGAFRVNRHDFGINYKAGLLLPAIKKDIDIVFDVNFKLQ